MSVIVRTPSGKIRLYCKGAVSVCLSPWQRMTAHHHHHRTHRHAHTVEHSPPFIASRSCRELFSMSSSIKQDHLNSHMYLCKIKVRQGLYFNRPHFTVAYVHSEENYHF